ncbi:hypothetical protein AB0D49_36610 [Streptomyces sp. NPDC048290]|uniref:hypothetical protein n=1 Tax=Streptomyces sp. NPDC048290 TaxID=3155811 RepID=UPI003436A15A
MRDEITARVGHEFYSFDGRILELFGREYSWRFHIRHMYMIVTEPDRKGRREVTLGHGTPENRGASLTWRPTAAEWEQSPDLAALLDAVRAALDAPPGR